MYRSKRKAFTITELVIVIAVIAILAAVLIPTFSNVVESANKSAAMSNCRMAVAEYISMVTLDDDPDNNDVSGMVFSNDGYYFVYMDQKLAELGQAGKSNNILNIASDSTVVDAGTLEGFDIQTSRSADAIQTVTFTVNGKSTTVDLNELKNTGRALYLYNFQSEDGSKYAGFFVINAADGGDDYVISGANYSLVAGYSKYSESGPIKIATDTPTIEQPRLTEVTAQYTGIPVKAGEEVTSVNVTVTATYSDGSSKEVENFTASDIQSTVGKHNVTLSYTDGEVTLTCQAEVYVASGLTATLKDEEKPLVLKHNGTVDIDDVYEVYDIAYDLGDTTRPAQSAEVTAVVSDTVGQTGSVTLTCGAFQLTIDNLTVEKVFDSIKAVYEGGEIEINGKLDDGKVLVYAIFSDRTTEPITEGYTLSSVDTSVAGEKTVTVTYGEDNPKTATFTVTVVEVTANTYYFYNADGWASVYAYAWMEEAVPVTPAKGDFVIMGDVLGAETQWTADSSVKLFYNESANQYEFKGLRLSAGMQFKIVQLGETEHTYYNTLEQYVDASLYTYSSDGNIVIANDGIYDFYFKMGTHELYFGTGTTESTPNMQVTSVTLTETWPGTAMTAVEGQDGWYSISVDERAQKIIFNDNSGNQTANLDLNAETPYYNGSWYPTLPCIHEYSGDCDATCNKCGAVRETTAEHTYDNDCDADCNVCGEVRAVEHRYVVKYDETNHWEECEICLSVKADSTQPHEFTMQHNSTHHWNECACGYVDESSREEHTYVDGFCTVCGAEQPEVPVVLESIEVTFTTQGVVFVNTEITASDLEVTKVMSNNERQPVSDTENVSVALKADNTNEVEGKAIYVVTYQGKTAEVEVTFTRELTGITAVATETTVEYEGTLELTVTANYDGAESATVTDYTKDFVNTKTGLQTVTVTYTENGITQTTTVQVVVNGVGQKTYFFKNTKDWSDVYAYAWSEEAPAAGDYIIVGINGNWDTGLKMSKMEDVATGYRYVKWTINEAVTFKVRLYQGDVWSAGVGIAEYGISYTVADGGNITLQPGTYTIDFYTDSKNINISRYDETDGAQTSVNIYTSDWPGTAMKKMPGYEGWYYITIDANAQKIIFNNNAGDKTSNLDLNSDYVYYNGTEWVTSILA